VDGLSSSTGTIIHSGKLGELDIAERSGGISLDPETIRDFVFSNVKLTDDEAYLHTRGLEKLGEIKLIIRWGMAKPRTELIQYGNCVEDFGPVHEKLSKAMVHRVGFDKERTRESRKPWEFQFSSADPPLYLAFRYRPLGASSKTATNISSSARNSSSINSSK